MKIRSFTKPRVQPRERARIEKTTRTRRDNIPSAEIVSLAGKVMAGHEPTREEIETLAGSILANAPKKEKAG